MGSLLYRDGGGQWQKLTQTDYENEDELQRLLAETPTLIPIEELGDRLEGPLITIGREAKLGSGLVDVLCLDQRGRPVVIEAKLRKNPEIRREVLAQAVSYAAHLEDLEVVDIVEGIIRPWAQLTTEATNDFMTLEECIEALGHIVPDRITDGLAQYLENGEFAVFIVVDEPHSQLRRTVAYLNSHADFDIYLVEVGYFRSPNGQEAISPRILDTSTRRKPGQTAPSFKQAMADADMAVREVDERLLTFAQKLDLVTEETKASRQLSTRDGIHLASLSPRWRCVQFFLGPLRDAGMTTEHEEISTALKEMTDQKISRLSPTVSCQDLLRSWSIFEQEVFPTYIRHRIAAEVRASSESPG